MRPKRSKKEASPRAARSDLEIQTRLLALLLIKGEPQRKQIELLSSAGLAAPEISELLGTTPATVRQTLYELRKTNRRGK